MHPLYSAFDVAFAANGNGLITYQSHPMLWDIATGKVTWYFGHFTDLFTDLCHAVDVSPDASM